MLADIEDGIVGYAYGTEYQVPVGFISGSCDWTTPVKYAEDYYHAITAPKKELQLIDGWGSYRYLF